MKVAELFESSEGKSVHARLYHAVTNFALKRMKVDPEMRHDMQYEAENDRFWSSSIDEVTHTAERYMQNPTDDHLDAVYDAVVEAVDRVSSKVVNYYSNSWNHAPGYTKPKKLEYPDVEKITDKEILAVLHAAVPEFKVAHTEHQEAEKAEKKAALKSKTEAATPELIQKCATFLNGKWNAAFQKPSVKEIQRKPNWWTDWWTVEQIKAFKTPADVEAAFKTERDRLEYVLDAGRGYPKEYDLYLHILNTPALLKKLLPLIKKS